MLALAFIVVLVAAWRFEGTKWQLSERKSLAVVLLGLPIFLLDWKFHLFTSLNLATENGENISTRIVSLVYFTLFLSTVKLLQKKADRDWFFLYLISFFEMLLAAGLSISPQFFAVLCVYTLCALSTIIAFEIRKSRRAAQESIGATRLLNAATSEARVVNDKNIKRQRTRFQRRTRRVDLTRESRRLPLVACGLLAVIFALALPIFLLMPRFQGNALSRANGETVGATGFSDEVQLGDIGRLKRNDKIVMRVRVEIPQGILPKDLKWRGVALDYFNGRTWRRASGVREIVPNSANGFYKLDTTENPYALTTQTFYLEPLDTGVLFAAPRAAGLQSSLAPLIRDRDGALETNPHTQERLTYRIYSDTSEPPVESLRRDISPYTNLAVRYLQLPPNLDSRTGDLAFQIINNSHATNRYDAARAIEKYLKTSFGYTLDLRAGGTDPLADFLFRVRAGHCEYFATSMAVMLRTQGIAARVVNGFQTGEYNDAADVYTVRQSDAHSWVEVYFPKENVWVTFDPTPAAGLSNADRMSGGLIARLSKYREAFELFWIQYVVAYDKEQQRDLARSIGARFNAIRQSSIRFADTLRAKFNSLGSGLFAYRGNQSNNTQTNVFRVVKFLAVTFALVLCGVLIWRVRHFGLRRAFSRSRINDDHKTAVEFYERMTRILQSHGVVRQSHQTPLEFASTVGTPEVLNITDAYTRVRYGARNLTQDEIASIENYLSRMEQESQ